MFDISYANSYKEFTHVDQGIGNLAARFLSLRDFSAFQDWPNEYSRTEHQRKASMPPLLLGLLQGHFIIPAKTFHLRAKITA